MQYRLVLMWTSLDQSIDWLWTNVDWSKLVWSQSRPFWDGPVWSRSWSMPKMVKRPDWTRLLNTSKELPWGHFPGWNNAWECPCMLLQSTPIFLSIIGPPPHHPIQTTQLYGQATTTIKPITPTRPATATAQWTIQTIVIPWSATSWAPHPHSLEYLLMGVLLNGDIPRATSSREPTGRSRQSYGRHTILRTRTSHSLWTRHSWRSYKDLVFPRVTHWAMAEMAQS